MAEKAYLPKSVRIGVRSRLERSGQRGLFVPQHDYRIDAHCLRAGMQHAASTIPATVINAT